MAYVWSTHAVSLESNDGSADDVTQTIVEDLYQEFGGEVPHSVVEQAVNEEAAELNDSTVTQYLALFIRRGAKERLRVSAN
ncbi:MAG: hypothetical protein U0822_26275 [Anaerolineae bacterium]